MAGKTLYHSLDGPTIWFEVAVAISGICKPTIGTMARLMRVIRHCIDRPTLSWRFKLDKPPAEVGGASGEKTTPQMRRHARSMYLARCLVETQTARQASVALSSGEPEFYALNTAGMVVMSSLKGMQLEDPTLTGRPHIFSNSPSARGTTKRSRVGQIRRMVTRHLCSPESLRGGLL